MFVLIQVLTIVATMHVRPAYQDTTAAGDVAVLTGSSEKAAAPLKRQRMTETMGKMLYCVFHRKDY